MHKTIIIGYLGKDPETKVGQNGKSVTKFSVAVNDGYGDKKHTQWYNAVAFDKLARSEEHTSEL